MAGIVTPDGGGGKGEGIPTALRAAGTVRSLTVAVPFREYTAGGYGEDF